MRNIILALLLLTIFACNRKPSDAYITVEVIKVEQVETYTYLLVKEKRPEYWVATSTMEAKPGDTYRYRGGLLMSDFYSKELDMTFEEVLFLDELLAVSASSKQEMQEVTPGSTVKREKSDVKVEIVEGTITIAELFSDMKSYEGKTVRIIGEVTKFNAAIMERNWVHLQDGTEYEGKYDLTATSIENFEVGTTVILEGLVTLDHDFGYGYSYDLLLENATAVK